MQVVFRKLNYLESTKLLSDLSWRFERREARLALNGKENKQVAFEAKERKNFHKELQQM